MHTQNGENQPNYFAVQGIADYQLATYYIALWWLAGDNKVRVRIRIATPSPRKHLEPRQLTVQVHAFGL